MDQDKKFYSYLGGLLNEEITSMDIPLDTFQKWDSVNILRIIKYFEREYKKSFSIRSFLDAKTVRELYTIVGSKEIV